MAYKQFSLDGVSSAVKYGVAGPKVVAETATKFGVWNAAQSAYVDFQCANMFGNNLTLSGNLHVEGTTTTVESTTLTVQDKTIELGVIPSPGSATDSTADHGGLLLYGTTNKTILWDSANNNWTLSTNVNIPTGKSFKINNVPVIDATSLGSTVVASSLTSVGIIGTGTWNADTVLVGVGGTGKTSFNQGDIVVGAGAGATALSTIATVASTTKLLVSGGTSAAANWAWVGNLYDAQGNLVLKGTDAANATSFLQVNNNVGNTVSAPVSIAANDANVNADTWLAIKAQNNGTILMQSNVDVSNVKIVATGGGTGANIYLSPNVSSGGLIMVPAGYNANIATDGSDANALVTAGFVASFVAGNSSTSRRADVVASGAATSNISSALPTPASGQVYCARVTVSVLTPFTGGSIGSLLISDGVNTLMPITDIDPSVADTYFTALPFAVTSTGAQLKVEYYQADGTTPASPTAGELIATIEYIIA